LAKDETAEFGKRIARARRELGLTQRELADRIGVMLGVLEAYETGRADPSPHLDRIAEATGKDALWFLRGEDPEEVVARLQRHAGELAKREAALQRREEELAVARKRTGGRPRELDGLERGRTEAPEDIGAEEQALSTREAELEPAPAEVADPKSAFEAIERREAELAGWAQTADRVATELRQSLATFVRLTEEASKDGAAPTSERRGLERRAPHTSEREAALLAREERLAAREAACKALELELQQKLEEARERAREREHRWRIETEAFVEFKRAEAELARREQELEERADTLAHHQRELEQARAAVEQRLAGEKEGVRETMAQLEARFIAQLADGPQRTLRSSLRRMRS
jgi:transcriptional regulator with XRE-family HTH domain